MKKRAGQADDGVRSPAWKNATRAIYPMVSGSVWSPMSQVPTSEGDRGPTAPARSSTPSATCSRAAVPGGYCPWRLLPLEASAQGLPALGDRLPVVREVREVARERDVRPPRTLATSQYALRLLAPLTSVRPLSPEGSPEGTGILILPQSAARGKAGAAEKHWKRRGAAGDGVYWRRHSVSGELGSHQDCVRTGKWGS